MACCHKLFTIIGTSIEGNILWKKYIPKIRRVFYKAGKVYVGHDVIEDKNLTVLNSDGIIENQYLIDFDWFKVGNDFTGNILDVIDGYIYIQISPFVHVFEITNNSVPVTYFGDVRSGIGNFGIRTNVNQFTAFGGANINTNSFATIAGTCFGKIEYVSKTSSQRVIDITPAQGYGGSFTIKNSSTNLITCNVKSNPSSYTIHQGYVSAAGSIYDDDNNLTKTLRVTINDYFNPLGIGSQTGAIADIRGYDLYYPKTLSVDGENETVVVSKNDTDCPIYLHNINTSVVSTLANQLIPNFPDLWAVTNSGIQLITRDYIYQSLNKAHYNEYSTFIPQLSLLRSNSSVFDLNQQYFQFSIITPGFGGIAKHIHIKADSLNGVTLLPMFSTTAVASKSITEPYNGNLYDIQTDSTRFVPSGSGIDGVAQNFGYSDYDSSPLVSCNTSLMLKDKGFTVNSYAAVDFGSFKVNRQYTDINGFPAVDIGVGTYSFSSPMTASNLLSTISSAANTEFGVTLDSAEYLLNSPSGSGCMVVNSQSSDGSNIALGAAPFSFGNIFGLSETDRFNGCFVYQGQNLNNRVGSVGFGNTSSYEVLEGDLDGNSFAIDMESNVYGIYAGDDGIIAGIKPYSYSNKPSFSTYLTYGARVIASGTGSFKLRYTHEDNYGNYIESATIQTADSMFPLALSYSEPASDYLVGGSGNPYYLPVTSGISINYTSTINTSEYYNPVTTWPVWSKLNNEEDIDWIYLQDCQNEPDSVARDVIYGNGTVYTNGVTRPYKYTYADGTYESGSEFSFDVVDFSGVLYDRSGVNLKYSDFIGTSTTERKWESISTLNTDDSGNVYFRSDRSVLFYEYTRTGLDRTDVTLWSSGVFSDGAMKLRFINGIENDINKGVVLDVIPQFTPEDHNSTMYSGLYYGNNNAYTVFASGERLKQGEFTIIFESGSEPLPFGDLSNMNIVTEKDGTMSSKGIKNYQYLDGELRVDNGPLTTHTPGNLLSGQDQYIYWWTDGTEIKQELYEPDDAYNPETYNR